MAKKKTVLWGRVFAFLGILLTSLAVFLISTNTLPSTTLIRSMLTPRAAVGPKTLNVLEIRYFPNDPNFRPPDPGSLTQLEKTNSNSTKTLAAFGEASKYRGYKNATAVPYAQAVIKRTITRLKQSPYVTGAQGAALLSMNAMLTADGEDLCTYIVANNIDAVWFWKDVRATGGDTGGFDQEYYRVWSNALWPGQNPAFMTCGGKRTFTVYGLDQNRTEAQAMHSIGHSFEGLMVDLQGTDLFWTKWTGGSSRISAAPTCGNIHFPPNAGGEYDYSNLIFSQSACENWKPDGTGLKTNVTCSMWGCSEGGYIKWWFQNAPNANNGFTYAGKPIPNWWDLFIDIDNAVSNANVAGQYIAPQFAAFRVAATPTPTIAPTPTVAPTPTPVPVTANIKIGTSDGPVTVNSGSSVALTWTSTGATGCTASGSWTGTKLANGSETIAAITANKTFTITCNGVSDSISVVIALPPTAPTVDIKADGLDRVSGRGQMTTVLSWKTVGATSCKALGGWTGVKPVNGSETVTIAVYPAKPVTKNFVLQCVNAAGSTWYDNVFVVVEPINTLLPVTEAKIFVNGYDDTLMATGSGVFGAGVQQKMYLAKGTAPSLTVHVVGLTCTAPWITTPLSYRSPTAYLQPAISATTTFSMTCLDLKNVPRTVSVTANVR